MRKSIYNIHAITLISMMCIMCVCVCKNSILRLDAEYEDYKYYNPV